MSASIEMPVRIAMLPRDKHGRPVPWFAAWIGGQPDFRVVGPGKTEIARLDRRCWVCGITFRRQEDRAFVIGPMCAVNRVSAEPPSHRDCAIYSATACPFLATPNMTRRERHLPEGTADPPGISIRRNPGVALVWVTGYRSYKAFRDGDGYLFNIGEPKQALWFARGREATRAEVLASIDSGLPILADMAERDGTGAVAELAVLHERALGLVPS